MASCYRHCIIFAIQLVMIDLKWAIMSVANAREASTLGWGDDIPTFVIPAFAGMTKL